MASRSTNTSVENNLHTNEGFELPKHSQHQERKVAEAKAKARAQAPAATASTNPVKPTEDRKLLSINGKDVDTSKPQWELKLTIAELKEFKAQQAVEEHNKVYPPRPREKQEAKKGKSKARSTSKAAKGVASRPRAAKNINSGTLQPNTSTNGVTAAVFNIGSGILSKGLPVAPCLIPGCPVTAQQHESKIYQFDEPCRPDFIKLIQAKGRKATASEWAKVDRFFDLHRFHSTQAKKMAKTKAEAEART